MAPPPGIDWGDGGAGMLCTDLDTGIYFRPEVGGKILVGTVEPACDAPCHLLHGNFVEHKRFMESLKRDSSGGTCRKVVADHRARDRLFRSGTPDARMLDMVQRKCCRSR